MHQKTLTFSDQLQEPHGQPEPPDKSALRSSDLQRCMCNISSLDSLYYHFLQTELRKVINSSNLFSVSNIFFTASFLLRPIIGSRSGTDNNHFILSKVHRNSIPFGGTVRKLLLICNWRK